MEALALAGAFDCFEEIHRAQYFDTNDKDNATLIERALRFGNAYQMEDSSAQASLFGNSESVKPTPPKVLPCEPWGDIEKLRKEKEIVGFYISGHPLDQYALEIQNFCTHTADKIIDKSNVNKDIRFAGIVTKVNQRQTKTGNPFVIFSIEDYAGTIELSLFGNDFVKFNNYLTLGNFLYIKGKYLESKYRPGQQELKIDQMELLSELRSKLCKNVTVSISLDSCTQATIAEMERIFSNNKGKCNLYLQFIEPKGMAVKTFSRTNQVDPNNEFFKELTQLNGVTTKIG
jgi:DNA polymerase-3 subunit alpha